jgi:hypothetical protein
MRSDGCVTECTGNCIWTAAPAPLLSLYKLTSLEHMVRILDSESLRASFDFLNTSATLTRCSSHIVSSLLVGLPERKTFSFLRPAKDEPSDTGSVQQPLRIWPLRERTDGMFQRPRSRNNIALFSSVIWIGQPWWNTALRWDISFYFRWQASSPTKPDTGDCTIREIIKTELHSNSMKRNRYRYLCLSDDPWTKFGGLDLGTCCNLLLQPGPLGPI